MRLPFKRFYVLALIVMMIIGTGIAHAGVDNDGKVCSKTSDLAFEACKSDVKDDFLIAKANCLNILDDVTRAECMLEAKTEKRASKALCGAQLDARYEVCGQIGEAAYDVSEYWVASNFVDPLQIGVTVAANPYFSLVPGTRVFEGGGEIVTVTVTSKTKLIEGVTCIVVNDVVQADGKDVEDTDDWYAQDINGDVWYCGEVSKNFEFVTGDSPAVSELVDIEGSWKAFRDSAMPGILVKANPQAGDVYRQEMSLSEAEDMAEVLDTTAGGLLEGDFCVEETMAIAAYIDAMCNGDCLVTRDYTAIEPGVNEHKYYAPGTGFILETNPEGECLLPQSAAQ